MVNDLRAARTNFSRVLAETRRKHGDGTDGLSPGCRMELAYQLSLDVIGIARAGLRAQGFSDAQIGAHLRSRQRKNPYSPQGS